MFRSNSKSLGNHVVKVHYIHFAVVSREIFLAMLFRAPEPGSRWARERCRVSPPRFLAECCKRQLNQGSFVVLYFRLSTFSDLY